MKVDDLVKVLVRHSIHPDFKWRNAKITKIEEAVSTQEIVRKIWVFVPELNETISTDNHRIQVIKRLELLGDKESAAIEAMVERDLANMFKLIQTALTDLIPNQKFSFMLQDSSITVGNFSISPKIVEHQTIGAFIEKPIWNLDKFVEIPQTREEPANGDVVDVYENYNYRAVVKELIKSLMIEEIDCYWQNIVDQEYADSLAEWN